jgi:hypothetical protein
MSKHTPGPWSFTKGDKERREMSVIHKANDREFLLGYAITESQNPHQRAEDIANARLMAAAPDLLDVLRRVLAGAVRPVDGAARLDPAYLDDIKAAIAKAEGHLVEGN